MNDKVKCFILGEETETFGEGKKMEEFPSYEDILKEVKGDIDIEKEWGKLVKYDASKNKRSFCGNKLVYQFFLEAMVKTRYKNGKTSQEIYDEDPAKVWERVCKIDRRKRRPPNGTDVFELNRAITFFKPSIAKYLTTRFKAKKVLDPCAGWGGRMLGCVSAGADYLGYDTNPDLNPCFHTLKQLSFPESEGATWHVHMKSCLEPEPFYDESGKIYDYDLCFTSPPYENLEVYEGMSPYESDEEYYVNFLIPMIDKCRRWVVPGYDPETGYVCINVSPKIYEKLTGFYGYPECWGKIDFLQQMGQKSGKKEDFIYVWGVIIS